MTLTTPNDNQPDWVKKDLGLESYKEFKLGQKVKYYKDYVYIIHIQKVENIIFFRGMLNNGVSVTLLYDLIDKPVETTNEQPINKLKAPKIICHTCGERCYIMCETCDSDELHLCRS